MIPLPQPRFPLPDLQIKVCGITQIAQAHQLTALRISYLGFIFYEKSPRYALQSLSLQDIARINHPQKVGVFVQHTPDQILRIAHQAHLQWVQLHGNQSLTFLEELRQKLAPEVKIIKVFSVGNALSQPLATGELADLLLFDTQSPAYGGTGKTFHWKRLNDLPLAQPYLLSGGIDLDNIAQIPSLKHLPQGIDINSRFELSPGVKDLNKIRTLLRKIPPLPPLAL